MPHILKSPLPIGGVAVGSELSLSDQEAEAWQCTADIGRYIRAAGEFQNNVWAIPEIGTSCAHS
jgi:hypothetical protein